MKMRKLFVLTVLGLSLSHPGIAEEIALKDERYSPFLGQDFPQQVWWGDTHVHTSYSTDAGMVGNRLGPDKAYQFALGQEVVSSTRGKTRLRRPLDFLVVADHAENLGLAPMIADKNPDLPLSRRCRTLPGSRLTGESDQQPVRS